MRTHIILMASLGALTACGTIMEGQTQPITILTPGAENAECHLYNEDMRYYVEAGSTREIMKSPNDLIVDCEAPGNRQRVVMVESQLEPATLLNATNGAVPGVTYDHFSRGLYSYPEVITVDFTGILPSAYPMPDYMARDLQGANVGDLEYYGPSTPAIPADEYSVSPMIRKKDFAVPSVTGNPFGTRAAAPSAPAPVAPTPSAPATAPTTTRSSASASSSDAGLMPILEK